MSMVRVIAAGAIVACGALAAGVLPGDAKRGEQLFQTEQCVQCHSINGRGGTVGPDLARRIDRDYTPAVMASLMWNHAPAMWTAMTQQGVRKGQLSQESAADLFAYFVSARYFEKPGDAGRGKAAFASKHCADCHGLTSSPDAAAPPVAKWESLADPVVLAQQMWNHGPQMKAEFAKEKATAAGADGPGTDGHAGLPPESSGNPSSGDEFPVPAFRLRREALRLQGVLGLP